MDPVSECGWLTNAIGCTISGHPTEPGTVEDCHCYRSVATILISNFLLDNVFNEFIMAFIFAGSGFSSLMSRYLGGSGEGTSSSTGTSNTALVEHYKNLMSQGLVSPYWQHASTAHDHGEFEIYIFFCLLLFALSGCVILQNVYGWAGMMIERIRGGNHNWRLQPV